MPGPYLTIYFLWHLLTTLCFLFCPLLGNLILSIIPMAGRGLWPWLPIDSLFSYDMNGLPIIWFIACKPVWSVIQRIFLLILIVSITKNCRPAMLPGFLLPFTQQPQTWVSSSLYTAILLGQLATTSYLLLPSLTLALSAVSQDIPPGAEIFLVIPGLWWWEFQKLHISKIKYNIFTFQMRVRC